MTLEDVIEILKEKIDSVDYFAYGDFDKDELKVQLGDINEVASYGGEDCGSTWYVVYHLPKFDMFIRVDGYYQSHHGTDFWDGWDSLKIVKPREKTITVYE